jgi:tetratricopeptide (TPR) repeat protein
LNWCKIIRLGNGTILGAELSKSIELQIHKFLTEFGGDLSLSADALLRAIEKQSLRHEDSLAVSNFLYHSGFFPTLIAFSLKNIHRGRPVGWSYFAEIIRKFYKNTEPKLLVAIIEAAESMNELSDLIKTKCLDDIDERLDQLRQGLRQQAKSAYFNEKNKIIDKIHFFRSQNALESERKMVFLLLQKFPQDSEGADEYATYQERKANLFIKNYKKKQPLSISIPSFSEEEKKLLQLWKNEHADDMDMAFLFYFIEDYNNAIECANLVKGSTLRNWFIAECLIGSKRFLDCLNFLISMEKNDESTSDRSLISISYYRAQCYYGLGQIETALAVIEGVLSIKPNYRMASTLHSQWSQELK